MRPVRPTVRVLLALPPQGFAEPRIAGMIRRKNLRVLDRIDRISHPLLDVARASVYAGHRCQHHSGSANATSVIDNDDNGMPINMLSGSESQYVVFDGLGRMWGTVSNNGKVTSTYEYREGRGSPMH